MTYRGPNLRHDCARRGCKVDQEPDLAWLQGCLPPRVWPSDVDAMVELNGHFLFLEHKGSEADIQGGQLYALRALAALPRVTVLGLRDRPDGFAYAVVDATPGPLLWKQETVDGMRKRVLTWARQARMRAA